MTVRSMVKTCVVAFSFMLVAGRANAQESRCLKRVEDVVSKTSEAGIPVSVKQIDFGEFYRTGLKDKEIPLSTARRMAELGSKSNVIYTKQHIGLAMIGASSVIAMDRETCEVLIKTDPGMGSITMQALKEFLQEFF